MVHPLGTPEAISDISSRTTLLACLERAAVNKDIVADVADACEIKEYTAMHLADPKLEASVIATELYLTEEEAKKLQECCRQEMAEAGITLAEGGELPAPLDGDESGAASANGGATETAADPAETLDNEVPEDDNIEKSEADEDKDSDAKAGEKCDAPVVNVECGEEGAEHETEQEAEKPDAEDSGKPSTPVREFLASSAPKGANRPQTAPHYRVPVAAEAPAEEEEDYSKLPSYLRPTASARKKVKKANAAEDMGKKLIRPSSASVKLPSSLLRPTATSQLRANKKHEPVVHAPRMAQSTNLEGHQAGAARCNRTTPKPFKLSTEGRGSHQPLLSTDEVRIMKAKKEMQALKEKSGLQTWKTPPQKQKAAPEMRASTQFKPFQLSSAELHARAQKELEEQKKEAERKEAEARRFKARPVTYNKAQTYTEVVAEVDQSIAAHKKVTQPIEPVLQSMQRSQVHKALEDERKLREAEAASANAAEQKLQEEQEAMQLKEMRKNLQFHAQSMPNFDSPFKPDPSLSTPPTKAKAPEFETEKRTGRRVTGDNAEPDPNIGTPSAAAINLFASSLRSSVASTPKENPAKSHKNTPAAAAPEMHPLTPSATNSPMKGGALMNEVVVKLEMSAV